MKVTRTQLIKIPDDIFKLSKLFSEHGEELYFVGGAVRDSVMGRTPKDFDVATGAKPDRVIEILRSCTTQTYGILEIGKKFGIVVAVPENFPDGIEIATFRKDIGTGRRPDAVEFTDIETDVQRRDFTINALFYNIEKEEIVDLVGGLADIENKIVRCVGSPEDRLSDDDLRKMRAVRFAEVLGFSIESETEAAIRKDPSLHGTSPERSREELMKTLKGTKNSMAAIRTLRTLGLLEEIFPGCVLNTLSFKEGINVPHIVVIASLLRGTEKLVQKLAEFKFTVDECREITFLHSLHTLSPETSFSLKKKHMIVDSFLSKSDILVYAMTENIEEKLILTFLDFSLSVKGEDYRLHGLEGAEIGKRILELETERFSTLLGS